MSYQIKFDADWSNVKKSLNDIMTNVKGLNRGQTIALFDKDSMNFLKGAAKSALESMKQELKALNKERASLLDSIKKEKVATEEITKKTTELLNVERKRSAIQKEIVNLRTVEEKITKGAFGKGFMESLSKIPMIGKLAGLQGMSGMGLLGLGVGGAIAGAGLYGVSRFRAGYQQYSEGLGSRVQLARRGVSNYQGISGQLSGLGMMPEEIRQAQLQSTNIFGKGGSEPGGIAQRATFARAYGLDLGQVQGAGAGLRAQMGVDQASRAFAQIQGSIIANKIDDAVGPYLETAAQMLTDINENGMTLDTPALAALGAMVKGTGTSPERAAATIQGVNRTIQGATGERAAFFQSAFAMAGIGAGTYGGTQEAMQLGLFGLDRNKAGKFLKPQEMQAYESMGLMGSQGDIAKRFNAINKLVNAQGFGQDAQGQLSRARLLQNVLGSKSGAEALQQFNLLERASKAKAGTKEYENAVKELKTANQTPEEKMLEKLGEQGQNLEKLGETIAEPMIAVQGILNQIDAHILAFARPLAKMFGIDIETPMEKKERMLGSYGLSTEKLSQMSPEELEAEKSRIQGTLKEEMAADKASKYMTDDAIGGRASGGKIRNGEKAQEMAQVLMSILDVLKNSKHVQDRMARALHSPQPAKSASSKRTNR